MVTQHAQRWAVLAAHMTASTTIEVTDSCVASTLPAPALVMTTLAANRCQIPHPTTATTMAACIEQKKSSLMTATYASVLVIIL